LKIDSEAIFYAHYGRIYGENKEFGGEYFVWAEKFQISKKYFRIFQKSLDISEIEISFPTSMLNRSNLGPVDIESWNGL
jgi:hypothetical protein